MNCTTMLQYKHLQTSLHCGLVHTDIHTQTQTNTTTLQTPRVSHRHKRTLQGYNINTCRRPFTVDWYTQTYIHRHKHYHTTNTQSFTQTRTNTTRLQHKHLQTSLHCGLVHTDIHTQTQTLPHYKHPEFHTDTNKHYKATT